MRKELLSVWLIVFWLCLLAPIVGEAKEQRLRVTGEQESFQLIGNVDLANKENVYPGMRVASETLIIENDLSTPIDVAISMASEESGYDFPLSEIGYVQVIIDEVNSKPSSSKALTIPAKKHQIVTIELTIDGALTTDDFQDKKTVVNWQIVVQSSPVTAETKKNNVFKSPTYKQYLPKTADKGRTVYQLGGLLLIILVLSVWGKVVSSSDQGTG